MIELDARERHEGKQPKPKGQLEEFQVGDSKEKTSKISKSLQICIKIELITQLKENSDLFAWIAADMPGIDLEFMSRQFLVKPISRFVA